MKKGIKLIGLSFLLYSCGMQTTKIQPRDYNAVTIETVVKDSTLNVRALEIDENKNIGFATSDGRVGRISKQSEGNSFSSEIVASISHHSKPANFRSMAYFDSNFYVLSIESPALLYKIDTKGTKKLVYKEDNEKAFYDAMVFWNTNEGIAIGDPTSDCLSVIITRDSGETWQKVSCDVLPKGKNGEAAFAASDSNIAVYGDKTWIATGGKASRILFSPDKGKTWTVFDTPIVQGLETTGMYSVAFYDDMQGFAIGGDYTKPEANSANKIQTNDGGKTWRVVAEHAVPGYRSCVQYVPNSKGKELVAIGFKGINYSNDSGLTWKQLSDEGFYTLRFLDNHTAFAAGNGRISKLTFK